MALIPAVIGIGSFIMGYTMSRYMAPTSQVSIIKDPVHINNEGDTLNNEQNHLPRLITDELKNFDKTKLSKSIKKSTYRTPTIIDDLHAQMASRRKVIICNSDTLDE